MIITRLKENDLNDLAILYEEFWGEKSSIEKMRQIFDKIERDDRYHLLVCIIDEEIAGALLGVFCENLYGNCNPFLVVEDVIVSKAHRRKSVGSRLMNKLEEIARNKNCENIILVTESYRYDAIHFYESLGFESDYLKGFKKKLMR